MNGEETNKIRSFTDLRAWREGGSLYALVFFLVFFFGWTSIVFATFISTTSPQPTQIVKVIKYPLNATIGVYSPCDTPAPYTNLITFYGDERGSDILLDPLAYDFGCTGATGWRTGTYYVFVFTDSSKPCFNELEQNFNICRAEAVEEFTLSKAKLSAGMAPRKTSQILQMQKTKIDQPAQASQKQISELVPAPVQYQTDGALVPKKQFNFFYKLALWLVSPLRQVRYFNM